MISSELKSLISSINKNEVLIEKTDIFPIARREKACRIRTKRYLESFFYMDCSQGMSAISPPERHIEDLADSLPPDPVFSLFQ